MPVISIPLYWPLTWRTDPGQPAGRYEDWLLWRYAHRQELAAMFSAPAAPETPDSPLSQESDPVLLTQPSENHGHE